MSTFLTDSRLQPARAASSLLIAAVLSVSACSSDSKSESSTIASVSALQGEWQAACNVLPDSMNLSSRSTLVFDGTTVERSDLYYVGSDSCSSGTIFNLVASANFSLPEGTVTTDRGLAQHINITTNNISATTTQTLDALLALEGITFDQLLQDRLNISDANNITPESVGLITPLFSLALLDGDTLYFGDSESNQGTEAETRLTTLDEDVALTYERL